MHEFDPEKIYQQMIDIANEDGIITSDEQALIDNVRDNIAKYIEVLNKSFEDEIITAEEQNSLYQSRKNILSQALDVAKKDDRISQDEFALLRIIRTILDEIEASEHY